MAPKRAKPKAPAASRQRPKKQRKKAAGAQRARGTLTAREAPTLHWWMKRRDICFSHRSNEVPN